MRNGHFIFSRRRQPRLRLRVAIAAGLAACALAYCTRPARAAVIEIDGDGSVQTQDGPAIYDGQRFTPIERPARAPAAHAPAAALAATLSEAGANTALSPALLEAVAWAESRFNVQARSPKGALGAMQLMPQTAARLGVNPRDARENVAGGALYLRQMLGAFDGDVVAALAAYNAGPEAVRRYGGPPPYKETQNYVAAVLDYMARRAEKETSQ